MPTRAAKKHVDPEMAQALELGLAFRDQPSGFSPLALRAMTTAFAVEAVVSTTGAWRSRWASRSSSAVFGWYRARRAVKRDPIEAISGESHALADLPIASHVRTATDTRARTAFALTPPTDATPKPTHQPRP